MSPSALRGRLLQWAPAYSLWGNVALQTIGVQNAYRAITFYSIFLIIEDTHILLGNPDKTKKKL